MDRETLSMLKELITDANKQRVITDRLGNEWSVDKDGDVARIQCEPVSDYLIMSQLSSLVDWLKTEAPKITRDRTEQLIISVEGPDRVTVYGKLNKQGMRATYVKVGAITPDFPFGRFIDQERMVISLQADFTDSNDKDVIMQVVSNLKDEEVHQQTDDGVTQTVTINSGVATVADVKVPNPVKLIPYRTFQEVQQPASEFIFRMREGGESALFEADNSMWQVVAKKEIKDYLENAQKDIFGDVKFPVMA